MGAGVIGVQTAEALAGWGTAGQVVAAALGLFVISVVVLMWKLTGEGAVTKQETAESTPVVLKIAAALLLAVAGYVQRLGETISESIERRRRG